MTERGREHLEAELSAYLDGELPPERVAEVKQHLAASNAARQVLAELRAASDQVRRMPRLRCPTDLSATTAWSGARVAGLRRRTLARWGQALAAAAVVAGAFYVGYEVRGERAVRTPVAPLVAHRIGPTTPEVVSAPRVAGLPPAAVSDELGPPPPTDAVVEAEKFEADVSDLVAAAAPPFPEQSMGRVEPAVAALPEPAEQATASVIVATADEREYAALAAMLATWPGSQSTAQAADYVYDLPATELRPRLAELVTGVADRSHVRVQLSFDGRNSEVLAQPLYWERLNWAMAADQLAAPVAGAPPEPRSTEDVKNERLRTAAGGGREAPRLGATESQRNAIQDSGTRPARAAAPAKGERRGALNTAKQQERGDSEEVSSPATSSLTVPLTQPAAAQVRMRVQLLPPPAPVSTAPATSQPMPAGQQSP